MAVRSERLALGGVSIPAAGSQILYTVPAGRVAIIRSVVYFCSAAAAAVTISESSVVGGTPRGHRRFQLAQGQSDILELWRVLEAGDSLRLANESAIAAGITWWVSGAELVV